MGSRFACLLAASLVCGCTWLEDDAQPDYGSCIVHKEQEPCGDAGCAYLPMHWLYADGQCALGDGGVCVAYRSGPIPSNGYSRPSLLVSRDKDGVIIHAVILQDGARAEGWEMCPSEDPEFEAACACSVGFR